MEREKWSHSGLAQHKKDCKEPMNWTPEVLSRVSDKNPQRLKHLLRVEEAMWIRRLNCGPAKASTKTGAHTSRQMHGHLYSRRCDLWGWGGQGFIPYFYFLLSRDFILLYPLSYPYKFSVSLCSLVTIENDNRKRCRKFWLISSIFAHVHLHS